MSKSYKKIPILKDNTRGRKKAKRLANKKVRQSINILNGNEFKKVYNSWNIYDYVSYCTLSKFMNANHLWGIYHTEDEMKQAWRRDYYIK